MSRRPGDTSRRLSLVSFLLERLRDDERLAAAAREDAASADRHAARHGPDRVLREVTAKRDVVQVWADGLRSRLAGRPDDGALVEELVIALARVYADHPDFDACWLGRDRDDRGNVVQLPRPLPPDDR